MKTAALAISTIIPSQSHKTQPFIEPEWQPFFSTVLTTKSKDIKNYTIQINSFQPKG